MTDNLPIESTEPEDRTDSGYAPPDVPRPDEQPDAALADQSPAEEPAKLASPEPSADDIAVVEAILFATDTALSPAKIADVSGLDGRRTVKRVIDLLNQRYEQFGSAFRIESLAGGYQMLTLSEYNDVLARLLKVRSDNRLSQAALEALAIIAYKQPILRANIEAIRGVSSGEMVRGLMEKGLVKIVGRAEVIGRPMLYGTTRKFLEVFGLGDLSDLPEVEDIAKATLTPPSAPSEHTNHDEEQPAEQSEAK